MKTTGIVCEFNPFHNGHAHLFAEARAKGAERIVCVMSGHAVQRGELAVTDAYTRAEIAVRCGADLVLSLPYPWSSASAEGFADAAVAILSDYVDTVLFGSECGDIDRLTRAAECTEQEDFRACLLARDQAGEGAAAAYFSELSDRGFGTFSSNDLLGIEYIRAAKRQGLSLTFDTVRREGAAYRDLTLSEEEYPSAGALRPYLLGEELSLLNQHMPTEALQVLQRASAQGQITDPSRIEHAILTFFSLHNSDDFLGIAEAGGGIAERICAVAKASATFSQMFSALRTKRYTDGRLRRAMLFCMTGVSASLLRKAPSYTTLLGANATGKELLSLTRKTRKIPLVTKQADAPKSSEQFRVGQKLDTLFGLSQKTPLPAAELLKKSAYLE